MNTCVSDGNNIINIQGIRFAKWGETTEWGKNKGAFFVSVTYKGNNETFYFKEESEARSLFTKLRTALDKEFSKNG